MENFFEKYREFAGGITDAPAVFHDFVARTIVGSVLGNRVWIRFGDTRVRSNLWVLLLAPSSLYRKSTAIGIGAGQLTCEDWKHAFFHDWRNCLHQLRLEHRARTSSAFDLPEDFAWLFTWPNWRKHEFPESLVSVMAESTFSSFESSVRARDLEEGLLGRFLMVPARAKEKVLVFPGRPDANLTAELAAEIHRIARLRGEAVLSAEAAGRFEHWSLLFHEMTVKAEGTSLLPFYARMQVHLLKLAVVEQAVKGNVKEVGGDSVDAAGALCLDLARNVKELFAEDVATTPYERLRLKVLGAVVRKGGIRRSELLKNLHLPARQLSGIVSSLVEEESIVETVQGEGRDATTTYSANRSSDDNMTGPAFHHFATDSHPVANQ